MPPRRPAPSVARPAGVGTVLLVKGDAAGPMLTAGPTAPACDVIEIAVALLVGVRVALVAPAVAAGSASLLSGRGRARIVL